MKRPDTLQIVAISLTLLGLITLYAASTVFTSPSIALEDISYTHTGDVIRTNGVVTSYRYTSDAQFMTLKQDDARISAVSFDSTPLDLAENERYRVTGRVDVYHGDLELIVHDVEQLSD